MASSPGGGGSPRRHSSDCGDGGASGSQLAADASCFRGQPPREEELHLGGSAEPASEAKTMQEQGSSSTAAASSSSPPAPEAVATEVAQPASSLPSTGSVFWARRSSDWGLTFFIRVDIEGSFHTYPDVGGPFQSLQEAQSAINCHLEDRRVPKMCMKQAKVSLVEMAIRTCLYFPDGTRKRCSKSSATEKSRDAKRRFVQALVDNHNNDHNLFGDAAYELKDVLQYYAICENHRVYYHFNFTAKTKGADDFDCGTDNLFFAEVKSTRQGEEHEELLVSCFCMLKPIDNGHCYGCKNHGRVNMKHPNEASAYIGGHLDISMPMTLKTEWSDAEDEEAEEARIRHMYKGHKRLMKKLRELPPDVKRRCLKIGKSSLSFYNRMCLICGRLGRGSRVKPCTYL